MKQLLVATAVAAALGLAATAQAGPVEVSASGLNGIASASPEPQNQGKPGYTAANGFHNGNVFLDQGKYLFDYWGSGNSFFTNTFTLVGSANYTFYGAPIVSVAPGGNGGVSGGYSLTVTNPGGAFLDFIYSTDGGTPLDVTDDCSVRSGEAVQGTGGCNYLAGVDGQTVAGLSKSGSTGYLGFADRREAIDNDHQDLTVRITVPEPSSLFLSGLALASLGFVGRRKSV
jgi:PEP-CTERM motif